MSDDLRAQISLSLGSTYIVERELEATGDNRLFVARELLTDRDVVVKVLSDERADGASPERFTREVHLTSGLQEPHTVPILTSGSTAAGSIYYTMPCINAETLRQKLAQAPVGFDDAVTALRDVARAMDHAHRLGIVHRGIEPEKVFMLKNTAVITDFGVANALEVARARPSGPHLRLVTSAHGTPAYMAPEHVTADPTADHRVDIYAWGVMAYEVLSDGHPFAEVTTEEELKEAHVNSAVPVLLHKRYGVPEQLALLVMRCLAKNPEERPGSATELLDVLERIPTGSSTLALESKNAVRWIYASIALALALFVAGATALWRLQSADAGELPLVAVLPFENNGAIADSAYPAALENALRSKIALLPSVRVVDAVSSRTIPRGTRYAVESGKLLKTDYVVSISLRWFHDADGTPLVQSSPTIIHIPDGRVRWTGTPTILSPTDPFAAQAVLSTEIAQALGIALTPFDKSQLATNATFDTVAFKAYTIGTRLFQDNVLDSIPVYQSALKQFEQAYTLDPRYADALGSAALTLVRLAEHVRTPALLDSAARAARRALALAPRQLQALTASSAIALAHNRPEEAITRLDGQRPSILADVATLKLHAALMLLFRDSTTAWLDAERLVSVGPRSPEALLAAAEVARDLRRFNDAREFLRLARVAAPALNTVLVETARIAKMEGRLNVVAQSLRAFRAAGGVLSAHELPLLRVGDAEQQEELARGSAATFGAKTRGDSIAFYVEKAKLALTNREMPRARTLLDTLAAQLQAAISDKTTLDWEVRRAQGLLGWADAARGDASRALASIGEVELSPALQRWKSGQLAANGACNGAQIYGFLGNAPAMVTQLRRCLTLPGGFTRSHIATEPALTRYANDPRLHALFAELGIEDARQ